MKTQQEVNNFFQENTVHVFAIYQIVQYLKDFNLKLPNNVILHEKGIDQAHFFKWFDDKTNNLKEIKYPTNYKECCDVLSLYEDGRLYTKGYKANLIQNFQKLLICRDAYWKIAGEEMGLDMPWKPNWNDFKNKYGISYYRCTLTLSIYFISNKILAFPTEEMRDDFFKNFKDLIEQCKELL